MITIWCVMLTLWLSGLTWYVVRMALAPLPEQDIAHVVQKIAQARAVVLKSTGGRELLRARLKARLEAARDSR